MPLKIHELAQIIGITQLSMAIYSKFCPQNTFLELLFYIIPQYFILRFINEAYILFLIFSLILILVPKKFHKNYEAHTDPIDRVRMCILFLVCLVIFLADFRFYNSDKYGKSMDCEFRLMDVGVGSFVFNSGLLSFKSNNVKKFTNFLKCFFFGTCRLYSKMVMLADVKEAEFGRHLNFFYCLSLLNLISIVIKPPFPFIVGLILIFSYQIALFLGLEEIILNNQRETFIKANLEGIIFIIPQFGLYLMSQETGKLLIYNKSTKKVGLYVIITMILFIGIYYFEPVARRLHNAPFCLVMFLMHTCFILVSDVFNNYLQICELKITKFGSKNLLNIFLVANLMVPISKRFGYFRADHIAIVDLKMLIYLTSLFYIPLKISKLIFKSKKVESINEQKTK